MVADEAVVGVLLADGDGMGRVVNGRLRAGFVGMEAAGLEDFVEVVAPDVFGGLPNSEVGP
jgi:hypothetical protein